MGRGTPQANHAVKVNHIQRKGSARGGKGVPQANPIMKANHIPQFLGHDDQVVVALNFVPSEKMAHIPTCSVCSQGRIRPLCKGAPGSATGSLS